MDDQDDMENYDIEYIYHPGTNLIHYIKDSNDVTLATFTNYQSAGKIGNIAYGNGVDTTYQYNPFSMRLERISTKDSTDQLIMSKEYTYYDSGDISDINDSVNLANYSYEYDRLHRLKSELAPPEPMEPMIIEFEYDDNDTITPAQPLHAPTQITVNGATKDVRYDENGNMKDGWNFMTPSAPVERDITYNEDNMPISINNGGSITEFIYDSEGNRARKSNSGIATYYFGDLFEYIDGTPTRYVFAGNLRVAKVTPGDIKYYHKDHLGSSTVMTDDSGNEDESTSYLPYGGQRGSDSIAGTGYKYTDQEAEPETGLYNYDARLYDPVIGRFVSADSIIPYPFDPQSLNRYSYCRNNPLLYIDPDGHREILEGEPNTESEFSVTPRDDSDSGFEIVSGGDRFKDRTEKSIANAYFTGKERYLNGVTADRYGFAYKKAVIVGLEFGITPDSPVWDRILQGISNAGGGIYSTIKNKTNIPNPNQQKNINRFKKKIPANSKDSIEINELPNDGVVVKATSPGKVPGSKAVYEKQMDVAGKTTQFTKTTYDPQGNIVHVKDKLTGETFIIK
jgi:RHS repeat-associated protein